MMLKIGIPQFFDTRNRMVAFKKTSDQQGCQISTSELPDSRVSMYLPKYWDYEARNQYLPVFGHEKSNGDI